MLLACTNCNTIFRIDRSAISVGRKVNCGVCKHVWIAYPENLIEEKSSKPAKQENNILLTPDNCFLWPQPPFFRAIIDQNH